MRGIVNVGVVFGVAFAGAVSAHADTRCTSVDGDVRYRETSYDLGPNPPPDFELGRTEWTLNGMVVDRDVRCSRHEPLPGGGTRMGQCPVDPPGRHPYVRIGFVPGTERTLFETPSTEMGPFVRKFAVGVSVVRPSVRPFPETGPTTFTEFMICETKQVLRP